MIEFLQTTEGVVTAAAVYLLIGLGWNLVYNTCGYLNLALGQFYTTGAIVSWKLENSWGVTSLWLVVPITLAVAAAVGYVSERLLLRPLKDRNVSPIIVTIGLDLILLQAARALFDGLVMRPDPFVTGSFDVGGVIITKQDLVAWATAAILAIGLFLFLVRTDTGRAMRACSTDPGAAKALGVRVAGYGAMAFTMGAVLAAAAALVVAPSQGATVSGGDLVAIQASIAVSIVGIGRNGGAVFGAFLVAGLEGYLTRYWSSNWSGPAVLAIFLLVLYVYAVRSAGSPSGLHRRFFRLPLLADATAHLSTKP